MRFQQIRYSLDPAQHALLKVSLPEGALHFSAYRLPAMRPHASMDATIGDNFDVAFGKQQINQHTTVVLRVPDSQR